HLMSCGFRVLYAHTQSDEISLLFHPLETAFGRKVRKYVSVLAGEASAAFTHLLGDVAAFDCRLSQLLAADLVVDYFRWRAEDAHRNALNAHGYWTLVGDGTAPRRAAARLDRLSVGDRNELLFTHGINFNDLPAWQKRGAGLWWQPHEQTGRNPVSGESVTYSRQRLHRELERSRHTRPSSARSWRRRSVTMGRGCPGDLDRLLAPL
ncbi:MAG: tRNA(His) guanylyltransferase Thg1 family protein, partial [Dehalococcoidia bacterium]